MSSLKTTCVICRKGLSTWVFKLQCSLQQFELFQNECHWQALANAQYEYHCFFIAFVGWVSARGIPNKSKNNIHGYPEIIIFTRDDLANLAPKNLGFRPDLQIFRIFRISPQEERQRKEGVTQVAQIPKGQ